MVYPNYKNKHKEEALITPKKYVKFARKYMHKFKGKAPQSVIICYNKPLMKYIVEHYKLFNPKIFYNTQFYLLPQTKNTVGILGGFGVGAPVTGLYLEELIAYGVKNFLSIGTSGSLQKELELGSLIVVDRAIRDEGTSSHYMPHSKYSYPSKTLTNKLEKTLKKLKLDYIKGTTWTTDAPFRETKAEIKKYQKENVLTVEMEASAIFAIAKYRKVNCASLITISDHLGELDWKPHFHLQDAHLQKLVDIAIKTFTN